MKYILNPQDKDVQCILKVNNAGNLPIEKTAHSIKKPPAKERLPRQDR
jgi:hypothetical protein